MLSTPQRFHTFADTRLDFLYQPIEQYYARIMPTVEPVDLRYLSTLVIAP